MPTNEERSEVAEKLRIVAIGSYGVVHDLVERYLGLSRDNRLGITVYTSESVMRLADLIEPRTCRKVPGKMKYGRRMPACGECGYSLGDDRWNFCPNCGCEVAEG